MKVLAITIFLILFSVVTPTPLVEGRPGEHTSPIASSAEDPRLGLSAVFTPVPSCLANVILVIYVQSLDMLEHMSVYHDMYGPYVSAIEFYVDGTWCDPRATDDQERPCYGEVLDRSAVPDGVNVVDGNGGGWMMQRSFIHAATAHREVEDPAGYLFMTDDVLLNIGQLSRAANESGCDVIWRSATQFCIDVRSDKGHADQRHAHVFIDQYKNESREFFDHSNEQFRAQMTQNLGSPSQCCFGTQNDFLYMPTSMASDWVNVARQMTDTGLTFLFTFCTAIFGIARMEDMVVLRTQYLAMRIRPSKILAGAEFDNGQQPPCWHGKAYVGYLLAMHIIHPNKLSSSISWNFALTLNPPGLQAALDSRSSNRTANDHGEGEREPSSFWCGK